MSEPEPSEEAIRLLGRAELQQKLSDIRAEVSRITSENDDLRTKIDNYRSQQVRWLVLVLEGRLRGV